MIIVIFLNLTSSFIVYYSLLTFVVIYLCYSLDTIAKILNAPQLGDGKSNDESTVVSSPTCHASVTLPEESKTALLFKERALKDPELEKKSPSRRKGRDIYFH